MKLKTIKRSLKGSLQIEDDFWREQYQGGHTSPSAEEKPVLGKKISHKKLGVFLGVVLFGLSLLALKATYLQAVQGAYYTNLSNSNRINIMPIRSTRGVIFDSKGNQLVVNKPIFDAAITPKNLPSSKSEREEEIDAIAFILDIPVKEINAVLEKQHPRFTQPLVIKENIPYSNALLLKIKTADIPSVTIETRNKREYLSPYAFSHIIGYEGKITAKELESAEGGEYLFNDRIGKTGLELSYESELRGTYGVKNIEVNAQGIEEKTISTIEAKNGKNLVLTIDQEVQNKVREILAQHLGKNGTQRASVVLMDPNTGEIRALVTTPDYDSNLFAEGISTEKYTELIKNKNNPLFNRSLKGEYPPGSTIKPVVGAAALEEKIITPQTTFLSTGGLWVFDRWFFPDWKAGGHGRTNIYKAIAWSVNTFFYIIGGGFEDFEGLGLEKLTHYYDKVGLGKSTGIDLPGEASGLLPNEQWKKDYKGENWYIGDTYHLAIGQGDILVTPLQVAQYTSIFANEGKLYRPHVVREIINGDRTKKIIEPKVVNEQVFDPSTVSIIKQAMRQTVLNGSAEYMSSLPVTSAGKTGTAQWHPTKNEHAWYTGFAPYENPELVITVLVEEGGEGSAVSVPIAFDIFNWYFSIYKK